MIKKLQKKFVIVAMLSITIVLFIIIGVINIRNYTSINGRINDKLNLLKNNGGKFPKNGQESKRDNSSNKIFDMPSKMSPETPFDTRYFTVTINQSGEITSVDIDMVVAINDVDAQNYVKKIYKKGKISGYVDSYKYISFQYNEDTMYIFLDCRRELETFNSFLMASIFISIAGLIVVFILILIFSRIIVRPVVETYRKQKQFITDANHELKTPLTIIGASCEILEYEIKDNEWTKAIKDQVERLAELTNKLIFLSRMDEEDTKTMMTDFSLSEVAEEMVKSYLPVIQAQNKDMVYDIESNLTLFGDMSMIRELIALLIDNAIKYSDDYSKIEISIYQNGKNRNIIISNTTNGVKEGNLDMLFERFYRLDKSRNSEMGGHGIGLSVVKAITDLHKGKVSAFSNDGKKVIFTIVL